MMSPTSGIVKVGTPMPPAAVPYRASGLVL
jgi:hypothetical protein